jgi:hypothetical protein
MATNITEGFARQLGQLADAAAQPIEAMPEPARIWMGYYAEHVTALLAERRTLRGMLERWLEWTYISRAGRCLLCGAFAEGVETPGGENWAGHTADCPLPWTRTLLREPGPEE